MENISIFDFVIQPIRKGTHCTLQLTQLALQQIYTVHYIPRMQY